MFLDFLSAGLVERKDARDGMKRIEGAAVVLADLRWLELATARLDDLATRLRLATPGSMSRPMCPQSAPVDSSSLPPSLRSIRTC